MRFLVGNILNPREPTTFANVDQQVPSIYSATNRQLRLHPEPRVLKSHERFDRRYPLTVYLVRDPRSVATSYYYYHLKTRRAAAGTSLASFVNRFVDGTLDSYGTWDENVRSWINRGFADRVLPLKYEDLSTDPEAELHRVADFLGIDGDANTVNRAVELCTAERMAAEEMRTGRNWTSLAGARGDIQFVRAADRARYEDLDEESIVRIEQAFGPTMRKLGYL